MKKILVAIATMFIACAAMSAQDQLEFLGVPVKGTVKSLTQDLRKVGFKPDRYRAGLYYGKYRKQSVQVVLGLDADGSDHTHVLVLNYPVAKSWKATVNQYERVKMALAADYGQPTMSREEYDYPYTEADGFRALDEGKCRYITTFSIYEGGTTDNGAPVGSAAAFRKDGGKPFLGEITLTISPEDRKVRVYFRAVD